MGIRVRVMGWWTPRVAEVAVVGEGEERWRREAVLGFEMEVLGGGGGGGVIIRVWSQDRVSGCRESCTFFS